MKKLFGFLIFLLFVVSCATTKTVAEKEAEATETASKVKAAIESRQFRISADYVTPQYMEAKFLTSEYGIIVTKDSLQSTLPFYGRAYRVNFDYESPFDFDAHISKYVVSHPKAGVTRIFLCAKNKFEIIEYTIDIYDNATVQMRVKGFDRDYNDFSGALDFSKPK